LRTRYALAEILHKTLDEIEAMTVEEFNGWIAYFKVKADENGKRK